MVEDVSNVIRLESVVYSYNCVSCSSRSQKVKLHANVDGSGCTNAKDALQKGWRVSTQNAHSLVALLLEVVRETSCSVRCLLIRPLQDLAICGSVVDRKCLSKKSIEVPKGRRHTHIRLDSCSAGKEERW